VTSSSVAGRLVLEDRVAAGRLTVDDGLISAVDVDDTGVPDAAPFIAPGFVDVHVHGWGGHDAMADTGALDGMARALLRQGVTSFLPTAVTAPLDDLTAFAERVRGWIPQAPADGAEPLGFNLEGPFLAAAKRGAHAEAHLRVPASASRETLDQLVDGLRLLTVAPELEGASDLIGWLDGHGVAVAIGHSAAGADETWRAYEAGARSTTHLFNAMTGVDHRSPGVAVAALLEDDAYVELIADGIHVHPAIWPLITRLKRADRLLLVSDALAIAGTTESRAWIGSLECVVVDGRATLVGTDTLAGSVIALDSAVRNVAGAGIPLPDAVAAATRNPLELLGIGDRGHLAAGQRADIVELDEDLTVLRVMRGGTWVVGD
jgi:N-acetylglucosamine-6-phosphate deacetylase